jgi:hypothetical protein
MELLLFTLRYAVTLTDWLLSAPICPLLDGIAQRLQLAVTPTSQHELLKWIEPFFAKLQPPYTVQIIGQLASKLNEYRHGGYRDDLLTHILVADLSAIRATNTGQSFRVPKALITCVRLINDITSDEENMLTNVSALIRHVGTIAPFNE